MSCCRSRCQICPFNAETITFQNKDKSETFDIRKWILSCSSNLVLYLIECKSCSKQYVGSNITPFRARFNNYKSGARKLSKIYHKKCNVYQEQFYHHFKSEGHNKMECWKITITERAENVLDLGVERVIDACIPNGLSERFVDISTLLFVLRFSWEPLEHSRHRCRTFCITFVFQEYFCIIWLMTAII